MLNDAWRDEYDCAVIVSNDIDLLEALRLVKNQNKKLIGVIFLSTDSKRRPSSELLKHADFIKPIRKHFLEASQLPELIQGTKIHKLLVW